MIIIAKEKVQTKKAINTTVDIQDVCHPDFEDNQFDVIIISNTLRIISILKRYFQKSRVF